MVDVVAVHDGAARARQRHAARDRRCGPAAPAANVAAWLARAGRRRHADRPRRRRRRWRAVALERAASGVDLRVARRPAARRPAPASCSSRPAASARCCPTRAPTTRSAAGDLPTAGRGDILHVSGYALLRPGSRAAALAAIDARARRGHEDQRRPGLGARRCANDPVVPRPRDRADRPAAAQRATRPPCSARRSTCPSSSIKRGARRRDAGRTGSRPSPRRAVAGRRRSSTPPAPATRSPPASSAPGRRPGWQALAAGARLAAQCVAQTAADPRRIARAHDPHPVRVPGKHLPVAHGRGRDARASCARPGLAGPPSPSTAPAPAPGTRASRPTPAPRAAAGAPQHRAHQHRAPFRPRGLRALRPTCWPWIAPICAVLAEAGARPRGARPGPPHLFRSFDPPTRPRGTPRCRISYYGGPQGFDEVLDICERGCRGLLAHLRARLSLRNDRAAA